PPSFGKNFRMRSLRILVAVAALAPISAAFAQRLPGGLNQKELTTYARLLAMTDTRTLDLPLVERALSAKWRPLRAAAALAIGQVGAPTGTPGAARLRALLRDRDAAVAANAAYALGLLRDTASVATLTAVLGSANGAHDVTREAAWALGEIGAPARSAIVTALGSKGTDHDTMIQLLLASAKMRPIPVSAIRPYLNEGHPSVMWAATYAIARFRAPAGVRDLIQLAGSPAVANPRFTPETSAQLEAPYLEFAAGAQRARADLARGLAKSAAGDSLGEQAYAVLERFVSDPDARVRVNALRSIATYGTRARSVLVAATRDADANVRVAAAQGFATVFVKADSDFAALASADTSVGYRSSLLTSAVHAGIRPVELVTWLQSADWRLRAAVANASGDSTDRAFAIARAMPLTRDGDPRVRAAAYGAIAPPTSMPMEAQVHSALINGLSDSDPFVRANVIGVLADKPLVSDFPAVLASYRVSTVDSANDARLSAVQYFGALWKKDSLAAAPDVKAALQSIPVPRDPLERAAGKGIPLFSSWAAVVEKPRPLGWYEAVLRRVLLPVYRGKPPRATIHTVKGDLRIELFGAEAPITVNNFLTLARSGYYRNTNFHRVVPNFVIQDGDPRGDGTGGPGYAIRDEMNRHRYERGALGMALSGPDTGGSQYFLTHSPQPHLDGHYTVFGKLISGFDVLDRITQGDLITSVEAK
ncbi:MAG: peptidylprolyl isomerase, partial [Gemmatimonadota bacterium]|nr:peptidylprolyl isomerase [Gemmatimonadota bacterium]